MYGTVARLRLKAGAAEKMAALSKEYDQVTVPGVVATYVYQADSDPQEMYLVAVFESKDAYLANANSPDQHARYLKMRELLESDPEWHDGTVVYSGPPRS
jgi:quinol monooxygenase YgiN